MENADEKQGAPAAGGQGAFNARNALLAALVIVFAAGAYFVFTQAPEQAKPPEERIDVMNTTEARYLLASYEAIAQARQYAYSFTDNSSGMTVRVDIARDGGKRLAVVTTPLDQRTVFILANASIVCENGGAGAGRPCADTKNSSVALGYQAAAQNNFIDIGIAGEIARSKALMNAGAMGFKSGLEDREYGGAECKEISYAVDYKKLTITQLEAAGIDPRNPAYLGRYEYERCVDPETLFPVRIGAKYTYKNSTLQMESVYFGLSVGRNQSPSIEELAANITLDTELFEAAFRGVQSELSAYVECGAKNASARDGCYYSFAVSNGISEVCGRVGNATKSQLCYLSIAGREGNIKLCENAPLFKDDCYAEAARASGNVAACEFVTNETQKAYCVEGATENQNRSAEYFQQCKTDSDCGVPAGCVDVCVQANLTAAEVACSADVTNACYAKSSCGCVGGVCSWKPNPEYRTCVDDWEFNQTAAQVDALNPNAAMNSTQQNGSG